MSKPGFSSGGMGGNSGGSNLSSGMNFGGNSNVDYQGGGMGGI